MVAGFQPGENQNPLPRAAGRFDHHPPLARTPPTPASASRSTNPSTGTSTRYAAAAATVSSEVSITTTHQTWSKMDPKAESRIPDRLNPDEPQLLCRTRKKKSRCGPSTNGIPSGPKEEIPSGSSSNPEGSSSVFYCWQRLFAAPRRFFTPALRRKSSRPLIYIETNCLYL